MLVHPWDAASEEEWRAVLGRVDFGHLVASGRDRDVPVVVPTHFLADLEADPVGVVLHLARPNPVWRAIAENPHVLLVVTADWAYIDAAWNTPTDPDHGVPTSHYTSVQLHALAEVVDDPDELAALLTRQLGHFEPADTTRQPVSTTHEPDRRQLRGIRGLRLEPVDVRAKQKYAGNKPPEQRRDIADRLRRRDAPGDRAAAAQVLRRLEHG